ncbi:dharma [Myxocyprinus asiaticus]|uniref:dharma n=1 Tax=Myxocyprinus asiaticus TaxID=70543 RepID=UPI00222279A6|nr:dharma [Myxocyprinus asiaticus]
MATQKFSNFSIDYILGESSKQTPKSPAVYHPLPSQHSSGHLTEVDLCQDGSRGHDDHATLMMNFPSSSWAEMCRCCVPVAYYQTSFNSNYYAGQQWPFYMYGPGCDKADNRCHQITPQRQRSRVRTVFTDSQTEQLDRLFAITDYPTMEARAELAKSTGLSEETVRVWFKNRRARRKRQTTCSGKSTTRAPDLPQDSD